MLLCSHRFARLLHIALRTQELDCLWWCLCLIPALGRQIQADHWVTVNSRQTWSILQASGQQGLHNETLKSKKRGERERRRIVKFNVIHTAVIVVCLEQNGSLRQEAPQRFAGPEQDGILRQETSQRLAGMEQDGSLRQETPEACRSITLTHTAANKRPRLKQGGR